MKQPQRPCSLSRALGLKKIDDLTKLIRELVLEPSSVKEDVKKVVDELPIGGHSMNRLSDCPCSRRAPGSACPRWPPIFWRPVTRCIPCN